jgi:hypothetical protein
VIDRTGRLCGVLSSHFREPQRPLDHQLHLTRVYARLVANALARARPPPGAAS